MKVSYSKLLSYETCPYKYKRTYIDGFWPPKSPEIIRGEKVHEFLQKCGLEVFKTKSLITIEKDKEILEFFDIIVKEFETIFGDVLKAKQAFFEKELSWKYSDFELVGRTDRVLDFGDYVKICDYKTGRFFEFLKDINEDIQFQGYSILGRKLFKKPIVFEVIQIRPSGVEKRAWKGFENERIFLSRVRTMLSGIEKGLFYPKKNPFCDLCFFKKECPLFGAKIFKEDKMETKDFVSTAFGYSIKTKNNNIITLKAEIGKVLKEGESFEQAFVDAWKTVEKQVEDQVVSLDLEKL